jgi:methylenetetrahydrofolate--tRNA-(uracil-5-)-methyltransferase
MLGGLYRYLRDADPKHFQPMNANFGLLEPLEGWARGGKGSRPSKERRKELLVERALADFDAWSATL